MLAKLLILFTSLFAACGGTLAIAQTTAPAPVVRDTATYSFAGSEVLAISNKIKYLQAKRNLCDSLIPLFDQQFLDYRLRVSQKDSIIKFQSLQLQYDTKNAVHYEEVIADLMPKWYDNKLIWLAIGAGLFAAVRSSLK